MTGRDKFERAIYLNRLFDLICIKVLSSSLTEGCP